MTAMTICGTDRRVGDPCPPSALDADPFTALAVHFGMLLGIGDFETLTSYPRGKQRLHNSWLHGAGVVWGLGVDVATTNAGAGALDRTEVRVGAGLALDPAGRELRVDVEHCVDLDAWLNAPEQRSVLHAAGVRGGRRAVVILRYHGCFSNPVPAIPDPCDPNGAGLAYGRVSDSAVIAMEFVTQESDTSALSANPLAAWPRVRWLLTGGDRSSDSSANAAVGDEIVLDTHPQIGSWPDELSAWRSTGRLELEWAINGDVIDRRTSLALNDGALTRSLFGGSEAFGVVLADIDLDIAVDGDGRYHGEPAVRHEQLRYRRRRSLAPTNTIQKIVAALGGASLPSPTGRAEPQVDLSKVDSDIQSPAPGIEHRRFVIATVGAQIDPVTLTFATAAPTQNVEAYVLVSGAPWRRVDVTPTVSPGELTLVLGENPPSGSLIRIVLRGTGATPVVGRGDNGVAIPFAGAVGGPPPPINGADATFSYIVP